MAAKDLIAISDLRYGTRMLKAGDTFTVSSPAARLLTALGRARLVEEGEEPAPKPKAERKSAAPKAAKPRKARKARKAK